MSPSFKKFFEMKEKRNGRGKIFSPALEALLDKTEQPLSEEALLQFLEEYGTPERVPAPQETSPIEQIDDNLFVIKGSSKEKDSDIYYQRIILPGPKNLGYQIKYYFDQPIDMAGASYMFPLATEIVISVTIGKFISSWKTAHIVESQEYIMEVLRDNIFKKEVASVEATIKRVRMWKNGKNRIPYVDVKLIIPRLLKAGEEKRYTRAVRELISHMFKKYKKDNSQHYSIRVS